MQEHPVPQNVTGYEFHLIGQMTLKQFMEVAGGILLAVIINTTNLPEIIKYPLMLIAGLLGAGLAFVPLEGRPLDRWFFAFIKSIYQPTMFFWKKSDTTPAVFTYIPPSNLDTTPQIDYTPIRQSRVREYIHTVNAAQAPAQVDADIAAADTVLKLFSDANLPKIQTTVPVSTPTPVVLQRDTVVMPKDQAGMGHILEMEVVGEEKPTPPPTTHTSITSENAGPVEVKPAAAPMGYAEQAGITSEHVAATVTPSSALPNAALHDVKSAQSTPSASGIRPVVPLRDFPFPNKPTTPNMLAGMVVNRENKIVESAIITILRQSDNTPVRAIKTNALGQFAVVTALEDGTYIILVEKDGLVFDKYSLVLNNQVVEPILLQGS